MTRTTALQVTAAVVALGAAGCLCKIDEPPTAIGVQTVETGDPSDSGTPLTTFPNPCEIDVDFGSVTIGQTKTASVRILNTGAGPLDFSALNPALDPEFGLDDGTLAPIKPGDFDSLSVTFQPYRTAEVSSTFTIESDGFNPACPTPSEITVKLTGNGVQFGLVAEPTQLDFGNTLLGTRAQASLTLLNQSTQPIEGISATVHGGDAALFTVIDAPASLAPNAQATVHLTYAPQEMEIRSVGKVVFAGSLGPTATLNVFGTPVDTPLIWETNPIEFGYVPLRTSALGCSRVTNQSNLAMSIGGVQGFESETGTFTTAALDDATPPNPIDFPIALAPGDSAKVCFTFEPETQILYEDRATLDTQAPDEPDGGSLAIDLVGWGGGPQIACSVASLDFGQTLDHSIARLPVVCTNVGTGTSDINLKIDPPSASPAVFSAEFDPTQSPYPPEGLAPGQSTQIDVSYAPSQPLHDQGTLFIRSNGGSGQPLEIPIAGQGLDLQPCQFLVTPNGLDFANVAVGDSSAVLAFEIQNIGSESCLVKDLNLRNDGTGAFHILSTTLQPDPSSGWITIPSANTGSVAGLTVSVSFSPATQAQDFSAEVAFTISDPAGPNQVVPLIGTSQPTCLVIAPTSVNFGNVGVSDVGLFCVSANRTFSVFNECPTAVSLESMLVQSGPGDLVTQFSSPVGPGALPLNVEPGASAQVFEMSFQPSTLGAHSGGILISDGTVETLLPVQGVAVKTGTETDTFVVGPPKADVLWTMDVDDDQSEQATIADELPVFFDAGRDIDYRMALTTDNDGPNSAFAEFGRLVPCPNCSLPGAAPVVVAPSTVPAGGTTADPLTAFVDLWSSMKANDSYGPDEHLFLALYNALQHGPQPGVDFFRPGAFFAAIADNGDDEPDYSEAGIGNHDPAWFVAYFQAYFQNPFLFTWNYVNATQTVAGTGFSDYLQLPPSIQEMVSATNGLAANTQDSHWPQALSSLWDQARTAHTYYPLIGSPSQGQAGISVSVDGTILAPIVSPGTTNWIYQATINAIAFNPASLPKRGSTVSITYPIGCR